ncbi:MAG: PilZ domain-containing protein [Myxococcaceae bacterium]|nr:PilZ domain-containing protein [Myxococcaceae bacterium]
MASGADKRKYPRVQARNVSAHLNVTDKSSPCVIQNISAGGVFIETREALPVGMPVAVNIARPGWSSVLKVTGRVVWALAERTAQRKGTVPGMRIRFDPLPKATADRLADLLRELGAPAGPPPPTKKETGSITEPTTIKAIQSKLQATTFPLVKEPQVTPSRGRRPITLEKKPDDATIPARVGDLAAVFGRPSDEAPKLVVQVQGLLMQLGELQQQLETREKELQKLKEELSAKDVALEKSDRERRAAELAIQRLSMQLAARR